MKKETISVQVGSIGHRNTWNGVKPYTRIQTSKKTYTRKGRQHERCADR